jgi:hypothetical protein
VLVFLFAPTIERGVLPPSSRAPLMIGFLGAYTTFLSATGRRYRCAMSRASSVALGLALWSGLTGCAEAERLLQPDRCTLAVMTDTKDGKVEIDPPYTLTLTPPGVSPPTGIGFSGTGWTTVDITQVSPDGVVVDTFRGNGVDDRGVMFPLDRPGRWTFALVDANAGCRRQVDVTVVLPV